MNRRCALFLLSLQIVQIAWGGDYFVSPTGNDANPGTVGQPVKSLAAARDLIRKAIPTTRTVVSIGGGDYELTETFLLDTKDSGTEHAPVIYQAAEKAMVRI